MPRNLKIILFLLLIFISSIFFFVRLGDMYLWEDEAETAVISRNILKYDLPVTYDGKNQVTQEGGYDSNSQHVWTLQSWLPHYVTAGSFKLFGVSTFTARLPYALAGLFTVFAVFIILYWQKKDYKLALLSAFFLVFNVLFVLHVRQCRYYALVMLFFVLWTFSYYKYILEDSKRYFPLALLSGFLLFNAQYYIGTCSWAAVVFAGGFRKSKKQIQLFLSLIVLNFPWIIYTRIWEKSSEFSGDIPTRLTDCIVNLFINLVNINHFIFPLCLLLLFLLVKSALDSFDRYMLAVTVFFLLLISTNPLLPQIRYIIVLVFPAAYILARLVVAVKYKSMQVLMLGLLICTNLFSLPFWFTVKPLLSKNQEYYRDFRTDLFSLGYELSHDYTGPIESFVKYSQGKGKTIFVSYEAEPIIFYTELEVLRDIPFKKKPDWIILRGDNKQKYSFMKWVLNNHEANHVWNYHYEKDNETEWAWRENYIKKYLRENNYVAHTLPVPNTLWENRPNLLFHRFGHEKNIAENLVIYSANVENQD